ncbi:MAG: S41 family peptidase, partial [Erythrobacter sp.]
LGAGIATLGSSDNEIISLDDIPYASPDDAGVIGLHYEVVDGALRIEKLLHPDPAARAAIPPDAFLATIDGEAVAGLDGAAVARRLRGPVGTPVTLGVTDADGATRSLTLRRVDWTVHGPSVASVRHGPTLTLRPWDALGGDAALYYQTPGLIRAELAKHADATQVILDLRGNTGGELQSAIDIADQFLARVDIGRMEGRRNGRIATSERWVGVPGDRGEGVAVTIVVDADTAAGAELIAAALADNRRARIVGTATFGRGSVQTLLPLSADYMLKLTTERLRRPSGGALEDKVVPDCEVGDLPTDLAALANAVAALTCAAPQTAANASSD